MKNELLPFNIDLLILSADNLKYLKEVKVNDIFSGATKNFHDEGLFSTTIFNKYGTEQRNRTYAFINLKIPIFHPVIFKALCDLKELYGGIINSTAYATWDNLNKNFVKSTPLEGRTGYAFFMTHFNEMIFEPNKSSKREFNIKVVEKYREKKSCMMTSLIVMPAGLRDFEVDDQGKPSEDEINTFYRKAISSANLLTSDSLKNNPESIDGVRYSLQCVLVDLYNHLKNLLEGKKKLLQGKFASRKIFNGTRNVITSSVDYIDRLDSDTTVDCNQTIVGLFQYLKATLPMSMYQIKTGFISKVFVSSNDPAILVNSKTLKKEIVEVSSDYFDDWISDEGLEKTINYFGEEELRHEPLKIGNYYIGLIYKGNDNTFKLFQDIDDLPDEFDKSLVTPVTFTELLYISVYKYYHIYPMFVTRYPIIGTGSIYPSYPYLKTTIKSEIRYELDDNWEKTDSKAIQFPITGANFVNSLSPHRTHIKKLDADYDGDLVSSNCVYSDESIEKVKLTLASKNFYIDTNGKLNYSCNTDVINAVLMNITG